MENDEVGDKIEQIEDNEKQIEAKCEKLENNKNEQSEENAKVEEMNEQLEVSQNESNPNENEQESSQNEVSSGAKTIQSEPGSPDLKTPQLEQKFFNEDLDETNPFKEDLNQSMDNLNLVDAQNSTTSKMMQRCKSESDLLAPQKPPRIFAKHKKSIQSKVGNNSPYDKYKARSMMPSVEEYPEDLNPFGDDDEVENAPKPEVQAEPQNTPKPVVQPELELSKRPKGKFQPILIQQFTLEQKSIFYPKNHNVHKIHNFKV